MTHFDNARSAYGLLCKDHISVTVILLGASIPSEAMMHFTPVSDFPNFRKMVTLRGKFSQFDLFPQKFFNFHPPIFFSHFEFPPIFAKQYSVHSPISGKFFFS